ncbi:MAG: TOBE domain-containing protein, partial [Aestuariivirga sp.]
IKDGYLQQVDSPQNLYDRPANVFVAAFIGSPSMNLLKGTIRSKGKPMVETEDSIMLPLAKAPAASDGRPAVYGIRPEHFALNSLGVKTTVTVTEPTGSETQVFAKLGKQKIVSVFRERISVRPGEDLNMMPNPGAAHLFDAETGARL